MLFILYFFKTLHSSKYQVGYGYTQEYPTKHFSVFALDEDWLYHGMTFPMDAISCPHCGKTVEISHVLKLQIEKEVRGATEAEHKKALEDAKKEAEAAIEQARKEAIEKSQKKLEEKFALQLKQAVEDAAEKDERNHELMKQLEKLMDEIRSERKEKEEMRFAMKKKLAEDEEKIRIDAQKKAEEEQQLKISEKDKQLQNALKEVEEMRRKLQQGSQQAQGEVFEEEFEKSLAEEYKNDRIVPVGKGMRGGDIIQEVVDARGNHVGNILWELKNTKTWSDLWIEKLTADKRAINAEEAVIITLAMPPGMKKAGFRKQIWITDREFVIPLADALRAKMIHVYYAKRSVEGKNEKIEIIYNYLSGTEFKHRVEAIVDAFSNMQAEIEKEKRYFMQKWARDEKNIRQVIDNTYGMHGDLKGIIGASLPAIAGLDDETLPETLDKSSEITARRDGIKLTLRQKVSERPVNGEDHETSSQTILSDEDTKPLF